MVVNDFILCFLGQVFLKDNNQFLGLFIVINMVIANKFFLT